MAACRAAHPRARRGVLLLVVLSMLTLFLMLGAAYLVTATRARESAQAFARLTFGGDSVRVPHARMLDTVLLRIVRSGSTPGFLQSGGSYLPTSSGTVVVFESLLADKYGRGTVVGTAGGFGAAASAADVLTGTVTLSGSSLRPTDLSGRLITFSTPGRPVTTHRILRAQAVSTPASNTLASQFALTIDVPYRRGPFVGPVGSSRAIINGREYDGAGITESGTNEAWDGFDGSNPFLAQVGRGATISTSTVSRVSFTGLIVGGSFTPFSSGQLASAAVTGTGLADYDGDLISDIADNDNDGVPDGVFLDFGLPDSSDSAGNVVNLRASVLVLDLDGRFNVNAHDGLPRLIYMTTNTANWAATTLVPAVSTTSAPIGSGYGPAEVSGSKMFAGSPMASTGTFATSENPTLFTITGTGGPVLSGSRSAGSRYSLGEKTQQLGALEGKYGEQAVSTWANVQDRFLRQQSGTTFTVPGQPGVDDAASRMSDRRMPRPAPTEPPSPNPPGIPFIRIDDTENYGVPPRWWNSTVAPVGDPLISGTNFNWAVSGTRSFIFGTGTTVIVDPLPRGVFNSPPDLHGRMRTLTGTLATITGTCIVPRLWFLKAEWSDSNANQARESADDPYELRLDTRRGFGGLLFDPLAGGATTSAASIQRDNPFTPSELEPVLRPYDSDANRLPPRLAAMLGSVAEESRLKVTTDSWDTTAITGSAALVIYGTQGGTTGWLQQTTGTAFALPNPTGGIVGGEVLRGERFDLNRPLAPALTTGTYNPADPYYIQRQAYCKDLYTLLVMLSSAQGGQITITGSMAAGGPTSLTGTAATRVLAQWAVNAVDFRDADSVMTPFEYDVNPLDGWDIDNDARTTSDGVKGGGTDRDLVFGAERPEIVITEAYGWENVNTSPTGSGTSGGLFICLHRPWNARATTGTATATITGTIPITIPGEPCDALFDTTASGGPGARNVIDLGRKSGTAPTYNDVSSTVYPVWRLRLVRGGVTSYVRFDTGTTALAGVHSGCIEYGIQGVTSGTNKPNLGAESTLCIYSGPFKPGVLSAAPVVSGSVFLSGTTPLYTPIAIVPATSGTQRVVDITGTSAPWHFRMPGVVGSGSGTIFLERLDDPRAFVTGAIWSQNPVLVTSSTTVPMYRVVDSVAIQVQDTSTPAVPTPPLFISGTIRATGTTAPATSPPSQSFWRQSFAGAIAGTTGRQIGSAITSGLTNTTWFPWLNRPFVSSAELMLVPRGSAIEVLAEYQRPSPSLTGTVGIPGRLDLLFDSVHVPTRFSGIHTSATNVTALTFAGISSVTTFVNHLSSFREPGRVNLNTTTGTDVWNAVVAGPLALPVMSITTSAIRTTAPAQNMYALLSLASGTGGSGVAIVSDTQSTSLAVAANPLHEIYTATRLANTVTPRSNVFAVWITLRESVPNDPDSVRYRRAFYIVDRSIPVAFEPGIDHNVWDCVRVRRIIE